MDARPIVVVSGASARIGRATEVTYFGTVWGTRAALKRMIPRDRGTIALPAHGRFDARARSWSAQLWLSMNRSWIALGTLALLAAGAFAARRRIGP